VVIVFSHSYAPDSEETSFGGFKLESLWGPSVFVGIEGEQMIGAATLNGGIHLLHTSYIPILKLLQTMEATLEVMARYPPHNFRHNTKALQFGGVPTY